MTAISLLTITYSSPSVSFENKAIGLSSFPRNERVCGNRKKLPYMGLKVSACVPSPSPSSLSSYSSSSTNRIPKTRLYISGLSFRTNEESLRNAFQNFGQLVEVNLVMDKIAKRPRGFAFIRYATEEEAQNAIEGMHGKFLDGRVIFVEIAKSRTELRQGFQQKRV